MGIDLPEITAKRGGLTFTSAPEPALIASGGWCAPSEQIYNLIPASAMDLDSTHSPDTEGILMEETTESESIGYDDAAALKALLVGRKIVSIDETTSEEIANAALAEAQAKAQDEYDEAMQAWIADGTPRNAEPTLREVSKYDLGFYSTGRGTYDKIIRYTLDSGDVLEAHAADGGCGCSNGCFTVDIAEEVKERLIGATILAVQVEETIEDYSDYTQRDDETGEYPKKVFINGEGNTPSDGSSTIEIFVYTDLSPRQALLTSEGGDNGYYGWGYKLQIVRPSTPAPADV